MIVGSLQVWAEMAARERRSYCSRIRATPFFSGFSCGYWWYIVALLEELADGPYQSMAIGAQFPDAVARDLFQQALAPRQQRNENSAAVVAVARAANVAAYLQAIDQLNGAVVF